MHKYFDFLLLLTYELHSEFLYFKKTRFIPFITYIAVRLMRSIFRQEKEIF